MNQSKEKQSEDFVFVPLGKRHSGKFLTSLYDLRLCFLAIAVMRFLSLVANRLEAEQRRVASSVHFLPSVPSGAHQ